MSTKLEYLKLAVTNLNVIEEKSWYIKCFAIPSLKEEDVTNKHRYSIVTKLDGLYYTDVDSENKQILVRITDYVRGEPLFKFTDTISADKSWLSNIEGSIRTRLGNLIVNALVLYPVVKGKIPYLNTVIKVSTIENILASRVVDDEVSTSDDISVSDMVNIIDRLTFLSELANIVNIASTVKTITKPPGIEEAKLKLRKEFEGQLNDPVKVVELENRLEAIDNEYLGTDPVSNKVFGSKSKTARKKLFLMYGTTDGFEEENKNKVVLPSLSEGLSTNTNDLTNYMDDLRSASFNRGSSTALSGYSYKVLQRSLSSVSIDINPCDTKRGIKRLITKANYKKLISRYILDGGWKLIPTEDAASKYIGKIAEVRSPMYCITPGNSVCYKCMSENYKGVTSGVTNIASNLSSVLMSTFLKRLHAGKVESATIDINDLVS